jgi:hypothetical protein
MREVNLFRMNRATILKSPPNSRRRKTAAIRQEWYAEGDYVSFFNALAGLRQQL